MSLEKNMAMNMSPMGTLRGNVVKIVERITEINKSLETADWDPDSVYMEIDTLISGVCDYAEGMANEANMISTEAANTAEAQTKIAKYITHSIPILGFGVAIAHGTAESTAAAAKMASTIIQGKDSIREIQDDFDKVVSLGTSATPTDTPTTNKTPVADFVTFNEIISKYNEDIVSFMDSMNDIPGYETKLLAIGEHITKLGGPGSTDDAKKRFASKVAALIIEKDIVISKCMDGFTKNLKKTVFDRLMGATNTKFIVSYLDLFNKSTKGSFGCSVPIIGTVMDCRTKEQKGGSDTNDDAAEIIARLKLRMKRIAER